MLKVPLTKRPWIILIKRSIRRHNSICTLILIVIFLQIQHLVLCVSGYKEVGKNFVIDRAEILYLRLSLDIVEEGNVFFALFGLVNFTLFALVDLLLMFGYLFVPSLPLLVGVDQQCLKLILLRSTAFAHLPQFDIKQRQPISERIYFIFISKVPLGKHHIDFLLNADSTWRARIMFQRTLRYSRALSVRRFWASLRERISRRRYQCSPCLLRNYSIYERVSQRRDFILQVYFCLVSIYTRS